MSGVVYYSHSYRADDGKIVDYFGDLVNKQNLVLSLDPPSPTFSRAKLTRHLNNCNGMIAVLNDRKDGVSQYILFEILTCIKAKKPLLVFIEDTLDDNIIPPRILQKRFSRTAYYQQVREHQQALRHFCDYLGTECPPRYQVYAQRRSCTCIGLRFLPPGDQQQLRDLIKNRGYELKEVNTTDAFAELSSLENIDRFSSSDIALVIFDESAPITYYLLGLLEGLSIPSVFLTKSNTTQDLWSSQKDFRIHTVDGGNFSETLQYVNEQFSVFEQGFLELDENDEINEYVRLLSSDQRKPDGTRQFINYYTIKEQINANNVSTAKTDNRGAVFGPQISTSYVTNTYTYSDLWKKANEKQSIEFPVLIDGLERLKQDCENDKKIVAIIQRAVSAAEQQDGSEVVKVLCELITEGTGMKSRIQRSLRSLKGEAMGSAGITLATGLIAVLVKAIAPF